MKPMLTAKNVERGFALPTVILASVIMLVVLVTAVSAVSSITTALASQYYNQLAREAAESGLASATACLRTSSYTPTWTTLAPLKPNTDCAGGTLGSVSPWIVNVGNVRTSYTVGAPEVGASGSVRIVAQGAVELVRGSSSSQVWRTYSYSAAENSRFSDTPQIAGGAGWKDDGHNGYMLASTGILYGWGDNTFNQLADAALNLGTTVTTPVKIAFPSSVSRAKKVYNSGQGASLLCILATDNTTGDQVYCRGQGSLGGPVWQRFGLTAGLTAKDVTVNGYSGDNVCVIASDNQAYCAGMNDSGHLGRGIANNADYVPMWAPVRFRLDLANPGPVGGTPLPLTVKKVFNQDRYTCVIASDDRAYCAGDNNYGQLGQGMGVTDTWIGKSVPGRALITSDATVRDIRLPYHSTAATVFFATTYNVADMFMSGNNINGTANDGCLGGSGGGCAGVNVYSTPRDIANGDWSKIISIGEEGNNDRNSVCIVASVPTPGTSGVLCMGRNQFGQLGNGVCGTGQGFWGSWMGFGGESAASNLMGVETNYQMNSVMVITTAGSVWAWGDNSYGKLGTGGALVSCSSLPAKVQLPAGVKAIALANSDEYTSFILGDNGRVYAMGRNNNGQLGDGTTTNRSTPVEVKIPRQETIY